MKKFSNNQATLAERKAKSWQEMKVDTKQHMENLEKEKTPLLSTVEKRDLDNIQKKALASSIIGEMISMDKYRFISGALIAEIVKDTFIAIQKENE